MIDNSNGNNGFNNGSQGFNPNNMQEPNMMGGQVPNNVQTPNMMNNPVQDNVQVPNVMSNPVQNSVPVPNMMDNPVQDNVQTPNMVDKPVQDNVQAPNMINNPVQNNVSVPNMMDKPVQDNVQTPNMMSNPVQNSVQTPTMMSNPVPNNVQTSNMMGNQVQNSVQTPNVMSNSVPNNEKGNIFKNKTVLIAGGVVLLVILGIIVYFAFFKKSSNTNYNDYDDYLKEQAKIEERINKNFTIKDYKLLDEILVELVNNNAEIVSADIKVEFYDETQKIIDVEDGFIYNVEGKKTGYTTISFDEDLKYSTYKITAKLKNSSNAVKSYVDKVTVLEHYQSNDDYIVQIKNNAGEKIDSVEVGVLFIGDNNTILGYKSEVFDDLAEGETATEKVHIPYDKDYNNIKFTSAKVVVLNATSYKD